MNRRKEADVYEKFIEWLGRTWWGLPASDQLMPLIQARYTVKEARFLTGIPHSAATLEEISQLKDIDPADLEPQLDELAKKGIIYKNRRGDSVRYRLNDSYFVFFRSTYWPGQSDELSRKTAPLVNTYYLDGYYEQYAPIHAKGLRALPINRTIKDTRQILPYEDVVKVLDNFEYFTVSAKADNKFGKAPVLDPTLCLGCGVCVHKCPTDSLTLERKEEIFDPPSNVREYGIRFMADRKEGKPLLRK